MERGGRENVEGRGGEGEGGNSYVCDCSICGINDTTAVNDIQLP